jgi:hypothetical protein
MAMLFFDNGMVANLDKITYLIARDAGARCNLAERGFMADPTA